MATRKNMRPAKAIRGTRCEIESDTERVYVISDLHGFLRPLQAFDEIRKKNGGKNIVFFNGDLFNPGPNPLECTKWIRENCDKFAVLGNHDEDMLETKTRVNFPVHTEAGANQRLSADEKRYFRNLTHRFKITWGSNTILCTHGHLNREGYPVSWQTAPIEQAKEFGSPQIDLTIMGHTHFPYILDSENGRCANPGALCLPIIGVEGQDGYKPQCGGDDSFVRNPKPSFLEITKDNDTLIPKIVYFDFDRKKTLEDMTEYGIGPTPFYEKWFNEGILDLNLTDPI